MSQQAKNPAKKILKSGKLKFNIEVNFPGDGRLFLNFWDSLNGNDIIAELKNGELYYRNGKKIELNKFLNRIRLKVKSNALKSLKD